MATLHSSGVNGTNSGGITKDYGAPRIDGLKMLDPDHVLLAMNIDPNEEKGRAFSYDWRAQEFITLAAGSEQDAHDVQWQPASSSGDVPRQKCRKCSAATARYRAPVFQCGIMEWMHADASYAHGKVS